MTILHIETSTHVCSVALSENDNCIFNISDYKGMNHATLLSSFIQEALILLKNTDKKLDAVAVSSGPGSYTGLRIGVSTAKGLCYGLDIPLIAINTLELMAIAARNNIASPPAGTLFVPMIDARRMEVYDAAFDTDLNIVQPVSANIITESSFVDLLEHRQIYFFGNGAEKCKTLIQSGNACFLENIHPLAENMILPAQQKYKNKLFEDVAYFEPFYLKEFQTTIPKKFNS